MQPKDPILPLYTFFTQLRNHGFELGVSDYQLIIDALNGGYGLKNGTDLLDLCRTLWYKPTESLEVFEDLFERTFVNERIAVQASLTEELDDEIDVQDDFTPDSDQIDRDESADSKPEDDESQTDDPEEEDTSTDHDEFADSITLSIAGKATKEHSRETGTGIREGSMNAREFLFFGAYRPVSERDMLIYRNYLKKKSGEYETEKLDIEKTIEQYCHEGFFSTPIFQKESKYDSRLLILIDTGGSMVAFSEMAETFANSMIKSENQGSRKFYFFNVPEEYLYHDSSLQKADTIKQTRNYFSGKKLSTFIISDAGAARGTYSPERIESTQYFLRQLSTFSDHIAWLNPVPQERWEKTSAAYISQNLVPMFPVSRAGLWGAINVIRGKFKHRHHG